MYKSLGAVPPPSLNTYVDTFLYPPWAPVLLPCGCFSSPLVFWHPTLGYFPPVCPSRCLLTYLGLQHSALSCAPCDGGQSLAQGCLLHLYPLHHPHAPNCPHQRPSCNRCPSQSAWNHCGHHLPAWTSFPLCMGSDTSCGVTASLTPLTDIFLPRLGLWPPKPGFAPMWMPSLPYLGSRSWLGSPKPLWKTSPPPTLALTPQARQLPPTTLTLHMDILCTPLGFRHLVPHPMEKTTLLSPI